MEEASEKMPIATAIKMGRKKRAETAATSVLIELMSIEDAAAYYRVTERDVIKYMFEV